MEAFMIPCDKVKWILKSFSYFLCDKDKQACALGDIMHKHLTGFCSFPNNHSSIWIRGGQQVLPMIPSNSYNWRTVTLQQRNTWAAKRDPMSQSDGENFGGNKPEAYLHMHSLA